jgi:type I restriction enzyme S subunit
MNKKVKLGEIVKIAGRVGWKGYTVEDLRDEGPWVIGANDITIDNRLVLAKAKHISREKYEESPEIKIELNDILIVKVGSTIGKVAIVNKDIGEACINPNSVILKNCKINPSYLYYYLISSAGQSFLRNNSSASAQSALNQLTLKEMLIDIVEEKQQENISSILNNLNLKIELNNRINTELEAMAKTLYDYWFVQFDFPDKNGKPYKTSGGKMVWNEELKREIPEGWEDGELKDIANITMGQSPPGESYNEAEEGMIFYQGCTDFGNRFPTVRKFTTEPTRFAKEGDILLSVRAPVGTLNISKEDCCIGRGLAALNSKDNCIAYLFGVMVNLKQIFDRRNVDGTTFGSITKDDLFSLKVIKPEKSILKQYHSIINPAFEKQNKLELENIKLTELRDWLLPMLMNGQVKVN